MPAPDGAPLLGLVDWGIGGLGVLERLDHHVPSLPVLYWSDTGAPPYGTFSSAALTARLAAVVTALAARGCTDVVLGCNAASTVAPRLARSSAVPVEGIIEHGVAAVPEDVAGVIGVVGGGRTVRSGAYRRGLARPDRVVRSRVAQALSAHIEAGRLDGPAFEADLHRIVAPLRGASAVVLACTHYPAAAPAFAAALPGTLLVDPADHLARAVAARHVGLPGRGGLAPRRYLTTGDSAAMARSARLVWGRAVRAEPVDLPAGPSPAAS